MRNLKHKIFRKNVIVAVTSIVLSCAILFTGFWFVTAHDTPIAYEDGLVRFRTTYADVYKNKDGELFIDDLRTEPHSEFNTLVERNSKDYLVLQMISSKNYYCTYYTERVIDRNGEKVRVGYVYLSQILMKKWEKEDDDRKTTWQTFHSYNPPEEDGYAVNKIEMYYLIDNFSKDTGLSDEQFYELRLKGQLVFNTKVEQ